MLDPGTQSRPYPRDRSCPWVSQSRWPKPDCLEEKRKSDGFAGFARKTITFSQTPRPKNGAGPGVGLKETEL